VELRERDLAREGRRERGSLDPVELGLDALGHLCESVGVRAVLVPQQRLRDDERIARAPSLRE
jgi:hypothetical protein